MKPFSLGGGYFSENYPYSHTFGAPPGRRAAGRFPRRFTLRRLSS